MIGQGGAEYGVRGFLGAYNAQTGKLAWKFYVVPGDPKKGFEDPALEAAAKTWNGEWWKAGGGGTPWDGIAYDPELNSSTSAPATVRRGTPIIAAPAAATTCISSSIVALNADTGKYVWHYQTTPGDNWDYNAAQPMILTDLQIANQTRKVIMQAPKNGFFYVLDRTNGKLLSGQPYAYTSWARSIDMDTGRPIETEQARYRYTPVRLSPSPVGAHHWPPMAFNPVTKLVYYPGQETQFAVAMEERFEYQEGRWNLGLKFGNQFKEPPPPDPKAPKPGGFFVAWDPVANREAWRIPFQPSGGALSVAGQLIFVGNSSGKFMALDPRDRQDALGAAAAAGHRDADQLRAGWQAVHRGHVGDQEGQGLFLRARCEGDDRPVIRLKAGLHRITANLWCPALAGSTPLRLPPLQPLSDLLLEPVSVGL